MQVFIEIPLNITCNHNKRRCNLEWAEPMHTQCIRTLHALSNKQNLYEIH